MELNQLVTATQAAKLIGRTPRRFNQLVRDHVFRARQYIAGVPLYARADIKAYLKKTPNVTTKGKYRRNGKPRKKR